MMRRTNSNWPRRKRNWRCCAKSWPATRITCSNCSRKCRNWKRARREAQAELQRIERELAAGQAAAPRWNSCRREPSRAASCRNGCVATAGNAPPLWQKIHVEAGWEDAVEAVLRERLTPLPRRSGKAGRMAARPSGCAPVYRSGTVRPAGARHAGWPGAWRPHSAVTMQPCAPCWPSGWAGIPGADSLADAGCNAELPDGAPIVTRGGDLLTRNSVTFFAPVRASMACSNASARSRRWPKALPWPRSKVRAAASSWPCSTEQLEDKQEEMGEIGSTSPTASSVHVVQMDVLKMTQAIERYKEQKERVAEQLAELAEEEEGEREREMAADERIEEIPRRPGPHPRAGRWCPVAAR